MHRVLVLGGGKIGRMIATFLQESGDYQVCVGDVDAAALARLRDRLGVDTVALDAADPRQLTSALSGRHSVLSALSFRFNPGVAQAALAAGVSYFDLTEDIETTRQVREVARKTAPGQIFMPQCGLAPGFISIVAHHLATKFDRLDRVHMRVGALPQFPTNALKYNLTWSTDGLINEYCNPCEAIHDGQLANVLPLEGLEHFSLDGVRYEAFNTSGGLGTLCETLAGRVRELNYRTIRYIGHRDLMQFLLQELRLSERRELLKEILENAIPITFQDVVIVFCTATGWQQNQLVQLSDARKIYMRTIDDEPWSAIQVTTASGICAALDLHVAGRLPKQGFVRQEDVDFEEFMGNRFGWNYHGEGTTRFSRGYTEE